jgi:ABC-2 type transport system ATP-binding protein
MGDIEELCKRVVIINKGKNIFDGELSKLKERYAPEKEIEIFLGDLSDRKKFAHIDTANKKIIDNKGIISAQNEELGKLVKDIYNLFNPENISVKDIETEAVIAKIFKDNKKIDL